MLLAALKDLGGCRTKRETIHYIRARRYFDVHPDDLLPYPSAITREPRWECLIAWSRKDGVERGWLFKDYERDSWQITRDGLACFDKCLIRFRETVWNPDACFLWTVDFKRRMHPPYRATGNESRRPPDLYRDLAFTNFVDDF